MTSQISVTDWKDEKKRGAKRAAASPLPLCEAGFAMMSVRPRSCEGMSLPSLFLVVVQHCMGCLRPRKDGSGERQWFVVEQSKEVTYNPLDVTERGAAW